MRALLLGLALACCTLAIEAGPAPFYDFECFAAGDEIEVLPLNPEVTAWMRAGGFVSWAWRDGRRVPLSDRFDPGRTFSPGYRNDIAWLTYAELAGWRASPECWTLARRYPRQN